MTTIQSLPESVLARVFELGVEQQRPSRHAGWGETMVRMRLRLASLATICLVGKRWNTVATPPLYSQLYLKNEADLRSLVTKLETYPDLVGYVQVLAPSTGVPTAAYLQSLAAFTFPQLRIQAHLRAYAHETDLLAAFLRSCPALEELDLRLLSSSNEELPTTDQIELLLGSLPPGLVALSLQEHVPRLGVERRPETFLVNVLLHQPFPALRHLDVSLHDNAHQDPLDVSELPKHWAAVLDAVGRPLLSLGFTYPAVAGWSRPGYFATEEWDLVAGRCPNLELIRPGLIGPLGEDASPFSRPLPHLSTLCVEADLLDVLHFDRATATAEVPAILDAYDALVATVQRRPLPRTPGRPAPQALRAVRQLGLLFGAPGEGNLARWARPGLRPLVEALAGVAAERGVVLQDEAGRAWRVGDEAGLVSEMFRSAGDISRSAMMWEET